MPTFFNKIVVEESTAVITASFTDENDDPVVPNSGLSWTLTDKSGTVINSRSAVSISPAATVNIVLTGSDLALSSTTNRRRVVTIEGTYNSTLGNNLSIKDQIEFEIYDLDYVT